MLHTQIAAALRATALVLLSLLCLNACGFKGPLHMPDTEQNTGTETAESAADAKSPEDSSEDSTSDTPDGVR